MKKTIFINMEKEIFRGNILDIGLDNYGVIYNIYKEYNDDNNIEYINGKEEENNIKKDFYDSCILLFSFSSVWLNMNRRNLIKDISRYLKKDGLLYIWDIDKGYGKVFDASVKILIPGKKLREIKLRDINFLKNNSKENAIKLLKNNFEILDLKSSDGIYYVKARKKAENKIDTKDIFKQEGFEKKNESSINSA